MKCDGRRRARDLEDPHEPVHAALFDRRAPPHVVQRGRGIDPQIHPDAVRQKRVDAGALVDLVEVGHGEALEERLAVRAANGRAVRIVQQPLGQIRGDADVLEALLVLDPDRSAAEVVGHRHGRVVHLEALEDLPLRQLRGLVLAEPELHAALLQPLVVAAGGLVRHLAHRGEQHRLRKPLLEEAHRVHEVVGDDRVVHPHAALVEDAHDGLIALELLSERGPARAILGVVAVERPILDRLGMARVVADAPLGEPLAEPSAREAVLEVLAPDRAVRDPGLRQRRVHVEHARRGPATRRSSWRASGSARDAWSGPRGCGSCTPRPPRRRRGAPRGRSCGRSGSRGPGRR